jgi:hypothetical protein
VIRSRSAAETMDLRALILRYRRRARRRYELLSYERRTSYAIWKTWTSGFHTPGIVTSDIGAQT